MRERYIDEEVITIGQIIRVFKSYAIYFLKKWWLMLLVALSLAAYRVYVVYTTSPVYSANLTFTLYEEGKGGGGGGALSGLIGQFGLSSMDNVDFDRIVEFMETRQIVGTSLFQKITIRGVEDYFANHYLREFKLYENWEEKEAVKFMDFWFTRDNIEDFTATENVVLNVIWNQIKRRHLKTDVRGSGIIEMKLTSDQRKKPVQLQSNALSQRLHRCRTQSSRSALCKISGC